MCTRTPTSPPACGHSSECWRFTPDDVLVNVLPLVSHPRALVRDALEPLDAVAACSSSDSFHPRHTLELVGQGTVFMAIPTFYYSFLDRPEFKRGRPEVGHAAAIHLRLGADPARGAARAGGDRWAGPSSTATA